MTNYVHLGLELPIFETDTFVDMLTSAGHRQLVSVQTCVPLRIDPYLVANRYINGSLDSPSNSLEMVTGPRTQEAVTVTLTPNSSGALYDSDLEAEPDPPDWGPRGVDLKNLSDKEKKRQDVINELFHSERSHVRHLKVLDQVFYRPMLDNQVLPSDHIQLLFSNLDQMLDIHSQFNNKMKSKRRESHIVTEVADLLFGMFDGPAGEEFQRAAATFCARQQIALELLKERRRKDAKLNNFLTDAEGNPLCRRLQLKDIIPTGMQRLTKYPLLFENLAKHTEEGTEELSGVQRALERSKEILNHVNQAKREAEDHQRLSDIMRRLDRSGFEKVDHPMAGEFKNLDLTKHRLIHEGPLNWRIGNRQKLIDLHVLLLEDVIILLQKQDEKFVLKFYNMNTAGGGVERSPTLSPIIKVSTVLVRHNAVDKKALYLVNTSQNGAQIYDLVATSSAERKIPLSQKFPVLSLASSGIFSVKILLCSFHIRAAAFTLLTYSINIGKSCFFFDVVDGDSFSPLKILVDVLFGLDGMSQVGGMVRRVCFAHSLAAGKLNTGTSAPDDSYTVRLLPDSEAPI
uniref:DH domain-containing protein n=1 Tax=Timema monikensis TaxID=170555 RepID=A0A7R9HNV0_9NEOP|nr:unnamed protein product [Timema monikensis]